jgi:predicted HTH domain antitoxin
MNIAIDIPEDIARQLSEKWGSLSRGALEAIAIEGYRSGALSHAQVQRILGHSSRWETDAFLKKTEVFLDYTEADLEQDLEVSRRLSGQ